MDDFFDDFRRLRKSIDRMFRDMFFDDFFEETRTIDTPVASRDKSLKYRAPIHDVVENEKEIYVTIELPGVKKDDIDINIVDNMLEVKVDKDVEKKEKEGFMKTHLGFYKKITLPAEVDEDNVKATYNNGILEIRLKKKKETKKKKIKID